MSAFPSGQKDFVLFMKCAVIYFLEFAAKKNALFVIFMKLPFQNIEKMVISFVIIFCQNKSQFHY